MLDSSFFFFFQLSSIPTTRATVQPPIEMPKASRPRRTALLLRAFSQYYHLSQGLRKRRNTIAQQQHVPERDPSPPNLGLEHLDAIQMSLIDELPEITLISSDSEVHSTTSLGSCSLSDGSSDTSNDTSDSENPVVGEVELPTLDNTFMASTRQDSDADDVDDGWDGDDESDGLGAGDSCRQIRKFVVEEIRSMYTHRYENPRHRLPRGPPYLHHVLTVLKYRRPDHFRQALRVSPSTFDSILQRISGDPVFANQSHQSQMPIEEQLAIALYRFGHNGNAACLQSVANWAGVGKGTVSLATRRVMTAVLRPDFMQEAVRMPNAEEKEAAKEWVSAHSCSAWRNGWCMVDGTLIPLYTRPYWYGSSYFDRKSNYSMNVQASHLKKFMRQIIIAF